MRKHTPLTHPHDNIHSRQRLAVRQPWQTGDTQRRCGNIAKPSAFFVKQMMMPAGIGVEINLSADRDLPQQACFDQMVQGVIDRRQRDGRAHFAGGGVNLLGRYMFGTTLEQPVGKR